MKMRVKEKINASEFGISRMKHFHSAFICSKSTIKTLEQYVKYVES